MHCWCRAGLENYQQLLNLIRRRELNIRLVMLRVEGGSEAYTVLHKMDLKDEKDKQIIIDLPTAECKHLLQETVSA